MRPILRMPGRRASATDVAQYGLRRPSLGGSPSAATPRQQRGGFSTRDTAAPPPANEPYPGLSDQALIRAIRGVAQSKKHAIDYPEVRRLVFSVIDNLEGKVECVYTGRVREGGRVPDAEDMNLEHIWPQSRGAKGDAKKDMHHIVPADSEANSERGNLPFGMVKTPMWSKGGSTRGLDAEGEEVFMPRPQFRGNVARAIFYFAAVYGFDVPAKEEAVLRAWDREDPVDAAEVERTKRIEREQGNANPFVLFGKLIERIRDI